MFTIRSTTPQSPHGPSDNTFMLVGILAAVIIALGKPTSEAAAIALGIFAITAVHNLLQERTK